MSPDASHLPPSGEPLNEVARDCFADCPATQFGPMCSARIAPECLHIEPGGVVRVSLQVPLAAWFEFLARLGEATFLARSSVAVLATGGSLPKLVPHGNQVLPRSQCGLFSPNLAEFATLWAVREIFDDGPLYLLEVRDARAHPSQRIVIPPGEARLLFQEFVCAHQSPAGQCRPWFPPNHSAAAKRRANLAGRIPWLRQQLRQGVREARELTLSHVEELLVRAVESGQRLRTMLYNRTLIWGAVWTPEMHAPARLPGDPIPQNVARFFGDRTGLELCCDSPASAWLWTGQCACCGEEKWAIEVGGPNDEIALALTAPDDASEIAWREFLQPLATP